MITPQIESDARTVLDVAEHFDRLKDRARELGKASNASTRGYFTPSEDEQVKHLLVSYWQSRNALIELVTAHQQDRTLSEELQHSSFLVAYAGALVLVDAARFLRAEFHHRPLVRGKLNEPAADFGIEANTYEQIQKSLTNPIHAWRLYHAAKYLNQHWEKIKQITDPALCPVIELVSRLQDRLHITLDRYALARVRSRARALDNTAGMGLFQQALYGLQKAVASLTANLFVKFDHIPILRSDIAQELRTLLQPGDVLITRKEFAVTNYFLPGYWPHAAMFLGTSEQLQQLGLANVEQVRTRWEKLLHCDADDSLRVLEAMKDGVHVRSIKSPFGVDALAVLRPRLAPDEISKAIARGFSHEGKSYDFDFDFNRSDRLVCTEVIYRSYEQVGGIEFQLTKRAGRWTLAAEDLIRMALDRRHFETYAVFSPAHHEHLALGTEAEAILRKTMNP